MHELVLRVKPPRSWIQRITTKYPATIRILDCKSLEGKEGVQELFEVDAPSDLTDKIVRDIEGDEYVYDVDVISGKGRIIGSLKTHRCTACKAFATASCYLTSVSTRREGTIEWAVLGRESSIRELLKRLEKEGVEFELVRTSSLKDEKAITARQEEILQIALERGYFDFPKGISLRKLASQLGISPATLSEILRRGQKKILTDHFRGRISAFSRQERVGSKA